MPIIFGRMKKILVIEDNREIRENTVELLELSSFHVLSASNGRTGFQLAKQYLPDLILCDMMMPETNGWDFLKMAKADDLTHTIPLIFFSAGSFIPEMRNLMIEKSDQYLAKPFTTDELLAAVRNGLNRSRA